MTAEATKIHGLTKKTLQKKEAAKFSADDAEVVFSVVSGAKGLIAHNKEFEQTVLRNAFSVVGKLELFAMLPTWQCTMELARKKENATAKHLNLGWLCQTLELGIGTRPKYHDASWDVFATAKLFLRLSNEPQS